MTGGRFALGLNFAALTVSSFDSGFAMSSIVGFQEP
jgi:hypothetical protein